MKSRLTAAVLALETAMMMTAGAADATPYWRWCSRYDWPRDIYSCAFATRERCMDTVRGIGVCCMNPYPPP